MYYLSNFCFICLSANNSLNKLIPIDKRNRLYQQIQFIFPEMMNFDPECPLCICSTCQTALQYFYKFKKMFMNSNFHMMNYTNTLQKASTFQDRGFTELQIIIKRKAEKEKIGLKITKLCGNITSLLEKQEEQRQFLNKIDEQVIATKSCGKITPLLGRQEEQRQFLNKIDEQVIATDVSNMSAEDMNYVTIDDTEITGKNEDFKCLICDKTFPNINKLRNHKQCHHGIKVKCEICDKVFRKSYLRMHNKIHANVKDYECTLCNKKFSLKSYLKYHMKTNSCNKPYECPVCNKKFLYGEYLNNHMKTHTGGNDYECSLCPKKFTDSRYLAVHLKGHFGIKDKEYECSFCKRRFGRNDHLRRHMKIHLRKSDFQCSICGQMFTSSVLLKMHNKKHIVIVNELKFE